MQFELDEDVFTTYLPHAMALGVVDRWIALFRQMSADGTWTLPLHVRTSSVSAFAGMGTDSLASSLKQCRERRRAWAPPSVAAAAPADPLAVAGEAAEEAAGKNFAHREITSPSRVFTHILGIATSGARRHSW